MSILLLFSFFVSAKMILSHMHFYHTSRSNGASAFRRVKGHICAARIRASVADERGNETLKGNVFTVYCVEV